MLRNWRKAWLIALALVILGQVAIRLVFHSRLHIPLYGLALHLLVLGAWLTFAALLVSRLPERWRGWPLGAIATTALLGVPHTVATLFDAFQMIWHSYVGMGAPVWLAFRDPELALSLLVSIGITPLEVLAVLAAVLALHLLLYAPVAGILAGWARRSMPRFAIPAVAFLALFLVSTVALPRWAWRREVFHNSAGAAFQMAPPELMLSGGKPRGPAPAPRPLPGARPLVLIVVDALRRDRMGVYDPARANTPFLTGLAAGGRLHVFRNSYSTCTFSFCGIMSLLASRSWNDFGAAPPTMLDALSRYSYRSYLVLGGSTKTFGRLPFLFGRGVEELHDGGTRGAADDSTLLDKLDRMAFPDPRHSFLYIHLMSTHAGSVVDPRFVPKGASEADYSRFYDAKVRQADAMIERTFAILKAKRLLDDALVIITADHGEKLGEGGTWFHGGPPDEAAIAAPLLVYDARGGAWPDRPLASAIDVAPTFLRGVGGSFEAGWRGEPLQEPSRRAAIPIGTVEVTGMIAAIGSDRFKYLCDRETGEETVLRLGTGAEGTPVRDAKLLAELREHLRTVAAPVPEGPCRR